MKDGYGMTSASLRSRPEGFHSGSSQQSVVVRAKRIVQYRRILELLVRRDLKVRYAGSALGYVWTVLDPLLMSLVYWFVFTKIFNRDAGPQNRPYMLYLVTGQLIWAWFNGGVQSAARALRSEAQMVRSSNVPRELWILRVAVSKGVEYVFGLPVLIIYALSYWIHPTWGILLLPFAVLLCFIILMGLGLILAPLVVLYRDLDRVIPIVMRVFFYASPVLYSTTRLPASVRWVYNFNPMVGVLTLSRATFFTADINAVYIRNSIIGAVLIFAIGVVVFVRLERAVLKEI
jgi:ABC-2 type transport system permease protein